MLWVLLVVENLFWERGFFVCLPAEGTRGKPRTTVLRLEHLVRRFLVFRDEILLLIPILVPVHLIWSATILVALSLYRLICNSAQLSLF